MIGKTISHYKILEKLGEGGMGVVYKVADTKLNRTVALKFLPTILTQDEEAKERFIHEAKAASALQHNNICTIHDIEEMPDGKIFIAMDYYEGETLKEKIKRGPLPIDSAINMAIQVAKGLDAAHQVGMVHRDIKPANIMITSKGDVKIVDFGLAKLAGQSKLTKTGSTIGTVTYMSPEQARGEEVDQRSDIWSLGVVLYEMITGRPPFRGDYEQALMYSIINEEPEPPSSLRTGVPLEIERITRKAMTKNLDERYQHLDDLLADMRTIQRTRETGSKISQPREQMSKLKRPIYFYLGLSFVVLLVISAFVYFTLQKKGTLESAPIPIAVMPFENRSGKGELNYLCEMVQDLLITKLGNSKYLNVMTRERMNDLLKQMGKQGAAIDKELGFELCQKDGIETAVVGSVNKADEMYLTDIKVLDVESKKLLTSASAQGQGVSSILQTQIDELSKEVSRAIGLTATKIAANQLPIAEVTTTSTEAYQFYLKGRAEFENENWEDARVLLERAVQFDSTFAIAQLYLGITYAVLRNNNSMKQASEKAKNFSKKAPNKERLLIEGLFVWHILGNSEKGLQIFKQMVKKYPKEKFPHIYLGVNYRNNQMYSDAIAEFDKALQIDPKFGWAYINLSDVCTLIGDSSKAIHYLKQYASVVPGNASPFDRLGDLYFRLGRLDDASKNYQEALQIAPEFSSNWKLAYVCALKEDYAAALKCLDKYIMTARSPGPKAEGIAWQAFLHSWIGKYQLALRELTQVADLAEKLGHLYGSAGANWICGWIYLDLGDYRSSRKFFERYYQISQRWGFDPSANLFNRLINTAFISVNEGKIDSVKLKLNKMDSLFSIWNQRSSENYWYTRISAELFLLQGLPDKAMDSWCGATLSMPVMDLDLLMNLNTPFLKDCTARIYIKKGDLDKAIEEYNRLITFDYSSRSRQLIHPKLYHRLAKLYQQKGEKEKAIKNYKKFLDIWQEADKDLPDLVDAKARLAKLSAGK